MSTTRFTQASIPDNAINKTLDSQFRVEIVSKNNVDGHNMEPPSWLTSPGNIFSNPWNGYNSSMGLYESISH